MVVIENTPPLPPLPAIRMPAPGYAIPESADERIARALVTPESRNEQASQLTERAGQYQVQVPDRIPPHCIVGSARTYNLNPLLLLSILKVESNGRTGIISRNTNGSDDLGPSQFNTDSWAKVLTVKYKIPREALIHDMCQAVRALGFALRTEINQAGGDLWKGIGNYHSRTPKHHIKYIGLVFGAYKQMTVKGKF